MKLSEYSQKWLSTVGMLKKPATLASMRSHVQKMEKFFGEADIEAVTEEQAQQYISSLFKQLSPQALRTYWGTSRLIFDRARKEGLIAVAPEPVLPKGGQKPQLFFDVKQLQALSRLDAGYFLLAETGLRAGEFLGLKKSDIDFENQTLTVNRSVYAAKEQAPKTANAFRTISISSRLCETIRGKALGVSDNFIFATKNNTAQYQSNLLKKLHKDAGKSIGFHAFRRGNGTLLAELGCPIKTISQRHGRSTGDLTVDTYICSKLNDKEWAEKLGSILSMK